MKIETEYAAAYRCVAAADPRSAAVCPDIACNNIACNVCIHGCVLKLNQTGRCRARRNVNGIIIPINYAKISSIALDPIEKKPLALYYPGSTVLSVGSFGCNMACQFCQNHEISMSSDKTCNVTHITPEQLVQTALSLRDKKNIGAAFTYNEPLIAYEYVVDCARLLHDNGLKCVVVTNGAFTMETAAAVLPHVDALNIDLKCFTPDGYRSLGGDLETVKNFIIAAAAQCHIELTTLIVPGLNDTCEEIDNLSQWVSSVSPEIPLHITRFYPRWKMASGQPTPIDTVKKCAQTARINLKNVFVGNC